MSWTDLLSSSAKNLIVNKEQNNPQNWMSLLSSSTRALIKPTSIAEKGSKLEQVMRAGQQAQQEIQTKIGQPFAKKTVGLAKRTVPALSEPGTTYATPYLKSKGVSPILAGGIGLGLDILAPGGGGEKKAVGKITGLAKKGLPDLSTILRGTKGMTADDIMKTHPNIKLTREIKGRDISGNPITIDKGEKLTPYELKDNKILLQDGDTYIINKNQFQNIKGQSIEATGKPFAPELEVLEESIKGASKWQGNNLIDNGQTLASVVKNEDGTWSYMSDFSEGSDTFKTKALAIEDAEMETLGVYSESSTKYSSYQLPEGKNYKEILIRAPEKKEPYDWFELLTPREFDRYLELFEKENKTSQEIIEFNNLQSTRLKEEINKKINFKSSHWDEPNVISHLRMNDRTYKGKKVTFMEELQSDWAKGARAGKDIPQNENLKKWQELSIKRALKDAVDNNSEYFAWINGEQTSARYNLATYLENTKWNAGKTGVKKIELKPKTGEDIVLAIDKNGEVLTSSQSQMIGKKLDEVLGKGLADKIMEKESGTLAGEGLKFGGEWASNLYDKQVGNIVKDLTGGKIEILDMKLPIDEKYQNNFKVIPEKIVSAIQAVEGRKPTQEGLKQISIDELKNRAYQGLKGGKAEFDQIIKESGQLHRPTTTQQGIRLTPEIKAKIKGIAPKIKTSGKRYGGLPGREKNDN